MMQLPIREQTFCESGVNVPAQVAYRKTRSREVEPKVPTKPIRELVQAQPGVYKKFV